MRRLVQFLAVILLSWPGNTVLAADPPSIETFLGSWKGKEASSTEGTLSLEVRRADDGFSVAWLDLGGDQSSAQTNKLDADFQPTNRAGVYDYASGQGSFLTSMFADAATGDPLEGETLLWARIDGQTLAVYSMRVDMKGSFELDHYSWTRTGDGLRLLFRKRTGDTDAETRLEGELISEGG